MSGTSKGGAALRKAVHTNSVLWTALLQVQREESAALASLADEVMASALEE